MRPDQAGEVRRMIHTVAHDIFHDRDTLEETLAYYATAWPLVDLDDVQHNYFDNGGALLVMVDEERVVGSGGLVRLEEGVGEIRRLWFLPEYQGRGLGYQMMMRLLELAREKGYHTVRLETSPSYQKRAYDFYRRLGFYEIPRYGDEDDDIGMELII